MNITYKYDILDYHLFYVDEIDSTNTFLKDNYISYPDKTILIAEKQTNGRGRNNHKWVSSNDLTFSILFKEKQNYLIPALAIVNALKSFNIISLIKWPNDVYLDDMKISGILIEDVYQEEFMASIVGIGINLTDKPDFNVKDLKELYTLDKYELLKKIALEYNILMKLDQKSLIELYKKYSLVLGRYIKYENDIYEVINIDIDGHLIVSNSNGIKEISYGEIEIKKALI